MTSAAVLLLLVTTRSAAQDTPEPPVAPDPPAAPAEESGASPAEPEGPSPVAACADAAEGTRVEVCLQLVAEHPEALDGIAAALRAHIARGAVADRDLLLALLGLADDRTAAEAAIRVAAVGDPRGLPALVACGEQRAPDVAIACIGAVGAYAEGMTPLARWVADPEMPLTSRIAAVQVLGQVGTPEAGDALVDVLRRPRLAPQLRRELIDTIAEVWPERAEALQGQVASDGRAWLAFGGAWGLGFAMASAGHYGRSNLEALGWVTGAVGGGTAGLLYGRAWPMESGDAAYIATSGLLGTTGGMLLGDAADPGSGDALYAGGLIGAAAGYGLSAATRELHRGTGWDAIEASGLATTTMIGAWGVHDQVLARRDRYGDTEGLTLAMGTGLVLGGVGGVLAAPYVDVSARDRGLIVLGATYGVTLGALWPLGEQPWRLRPGLPQLGLAGGTLAAYGLSRPLEVPGDVQAAAWGGAAYGGTFGTGVGLLIDPEGSAPFAGAVTGATAGLATGAALAAIDPEPLDDRDVVLTGLATGWAAWQAIGWGVEADLPIEEVGWAVLTPAAVGAGVAIATPVIDVPVPHQFAATSVGVWGAYLGATAATLADGDALSWSLVGSDIGLAGGALILSPLVGAPPVVIGIADAGGVIGGSSAALGAAFATGDSDTILGASLIGSGVGFAAGAAVGASWKRGGTRDHARLPLRFPGRVAVAPWSSPDGQVGGRLVVTDW